MTALAALRDGFGKALVDAGAEETRLVVLDGDGAPSTKTSLFAAAYPERFLQFGIAEQNMMGAAAGLASTGFIPVVSMFACFATKRALDQVRISIAQPRIHVVIAAGFSGLLVGKNGKTHQTVEDLAIMRAMPNMTVIAPADSEEAYQSTRAAIEAEGPVYLRLTRDATPVAFNFGLQFTIGRAVVVREGCDVSLITTGIMLPRALEAVELLERHGLSVHVLHVATLKPLDEDAIVAAADRSGLVVTCEEHNIIGGLGGAVSEVLSARRPTPVVRVGIHDTYGESGPNEALIQKFRVDAASIASAALELVRSAT